MPTLVFDFLGTLVQFDPVVNVIWDQWRQKGLLDHGAAQALFKDWYQASLLDYVAASHSGLYQPLVNVLRGTLGRTIYQRLNILPSVDDVEKVIEAFRHGLGLLPQSIEALQLALKQGWTVWIITLADKNDTLTCLQNQGVDTDALYIMSCDEYKVATPHSKIYAQIMRLTVRQTQKIENFYMISSHAWELKGAGNVSMRTVFLSNQELVYPTHTQGPDLQCNTLMEGVMTVFRFESSLSTLNHTSSP